MAEFAAFVIHHAPRVPLPDFCSSTQGLPMRLSALALLFLTSTATLAAPPAVPVQTLKDVTRELASDAYAGRAPTSPEEARTIAYLVARMKAAGLKPGNKRSWTQDVPMAEITATPTPLTFTVDGKPPLALAYRTDMVIGTTRLVPKIDIAKSEVVFVGYGVNAPELGWNDYAGVDVKGKTVVILINDPDWETKTLDGPFGGRAMTYYGRWTYKYEEAARQGAAAAIIVHDTEPAAYPFGVVVSSWAKPRLGLDAADNHRGDSAAIGWMTLDATRRVFAQAGQDFDLLRTAAKAKGFSAVPLGATLDVSMTNTIRRQMSKNVIGILPGRARPNDYVLYSAHWDHLGRCLPVKGDGICNGALDNATGTAGLIALAEMNRKAGPAARSQVFLAVTAEESGLLGSQYYAENPVYPLGRTVGGVNMDGLNIVGATRDVVVVGPGLSELDDYVARYAKAGNRTIALDPDPEKGYYFRSDHFSLAKLGVPMLYANGGDDLVVGGKAAGRAAADDYTLNRYHKPQDEYDPKWNWDGAAQDLTMYYGIGRELADGNAWPNWVASSQYRAIRDKSRTSAQ
jgi:Zn-dependent M28 family amino/carboxypeptidase